MVKYIKFIYPIKISIINKIYTITNIWIKKLIRYFIIKI